VGGASFELDFLATIEYLSLVLLLAHRSSDLFRLEIFCLANQSRSLIDARLDGWLD
jgi:hypothetical protein